MLVPNDARSQLSLFSVSPQKLKISLVAAKSEKEPPRDEKQTKFSKHWRKNELNCLESNLFILNDVVLKIQRFFSKESLHMGEI